MTIRTNTKTIVFRNAFALEGFDEILPAGAYVMETDEERVDGVSFTAYRRVSTRLHLHAESDRPGIARTLIVDSGELDAARQRDQAPGEVPVGG
jgi:hypothetical protein